MSGYIETDRERWAAEPVKHSARTEFERDRARIVHSASLRRLAAKTQVVAPGTDDFVRNRLTHTLEVAQVGRELGKKLGCDPDVVDTACLAHDLGHPPYGHNGEQALDDIAADIGGFEANAQTLRLLTRLEAKAAHPDGRTAGLNLTRASLDAATKYPWPRSPETGTKFGVYADDLDVFTWMRTGAPADRLCVEAQVMDFADDVAYCVHDVEDAIVAGRLVLGPKLRDPGERAVIAALTRDWYWPDGDPDEILDGLDRLTALPFWVHAYDGSRRTLAALKDMTSQLIGRYCDATEIATRERYGSGPLTRYAADLVVKRETRLEIAVLKGLAAVYVMTARDREPVYVEQREILHELVTALAKRAPDDLEPSFAEDWAAASGDAQRLRVIVDQVASLTDASANEWHARLTGVD
ncbi:MAG TPA: deoxyguanosinetriphosphate triphosphohydrolase [Jiangellaceae bacterium]